MLEELSSRPQPQHWTTFLDPWVQEALSGTGLQFGTLTGRAQLLAAPALDENRSPIAVCAFPGVYERTTNM